AIHGNKSQNARTRALGDFKCGKVQALVATDIAARGLDIEQLPQVVNFDLPNVAEDYVHRIGRTGRAGAAGRAYSLVSADEAEYLRDIEQLIRKSLPREMVDGFEPDHRVPEYVPAPAAAQRQGRGASGRGRPRGNGNSNGNASAGPGGNGRRRRSGRRTPAAGQG
ncbi:MAG: helicase-related protein, partial [Parahaliea sp.]